MTSSGSSSSPLVQSALRGIVLSVLAMPLLATQACSRASSSSSSTSTSDPLSTDAGGARGPTDALDPATTSPSPSAATASSAATLQGACAPIELDASTYDRSGSGCARYVRLPCGLPPDATRRGCLPDLKTCVSVCESSFRCQLAQHDVTCRKDGSLIPDAAVIVECVQCASGAGRRPRGLQRSRRKTTTAAAATGTGSVALGAYFAELAHLEAASVVAFRDLGRTLTRLGAPPELIRSAARAVSDEQRHAETTCRIARRFGGSPEPPHVVETPEPSLEELLLDNAEEGCVGESYGALVAMWQAESANDPSIARAMRTIARDEAKHAALSWKLFCWGAPLLDRQAQQRVRKRLIASMSKLHQRAAYPVDPSIVDLAGHPPPNVARVLVARFEQFAHDEMDRVLDTGRTE